MEYQEFNPQAMKVAVEQNRKLLGLPPQENTKLQTPELDICVSDNSNLIHIEEKVSGRNIATITFKGASKKERIEVAKLLVEAFNDRYVND